MYEQIKEQAAVLLEEYLEKANLKKGALLVVGCSSSEVVGEKIGSCSSLEAAEAVYASFEPILKSRGINLAAQCCEHLNRALILDYEVANSCGYQEVNVVPVPKAGGAFAATVYNSLENPVAVEYIKADGGIDIGGTLIGMHLKEVAVPIRVSHPKIGAAPVLMARVRPKFIGGARANYNQDLL